MKRKIYILILMVGLSLHAHVLHVLNLSTNLYVGGISDYTGDGSIFSHWGKTDVQITDDLTSAIGMDFGLIDNNTDWQLVMNDDYHDFGSIHFDLKPVNTLSENVSTFLEGMKYGGALSAVLLGIIAVRRALSLGDSWSD